MENKLNPQSIVILYTTLYREGGSKFQRVAETLKKQKEKEFPTFNIICEAVESKGAFVNELTGVAKKGSKIHELHFIGHSGMYGIMFGTTSWPEQLSPHEWRNLEIPFADEAKAFFHACRTARWFAPFFARTFKVQTFGYFWYTTVSRNSERFVFDVSNDKSTPLFIVSVPGKKSHGISGFLKKHLLRAETFPLVEFKPTNELIDTTYDSVAHLYDQTFEDITVRQDELIWLRGHLKNCNNPKILDIGCGTGSFVRAVRDLVQEAHGVDLSQGMITHASKRSESDAKIQFKKIDGPVLPYPDNSFDVVTSVLSFRYLDWDPIIHEILRVLKPGGRIMIIDMVAAPVKLREWPVFLKDKIRQRLTQTTNASFRTALNKMVKDPNWKKMLEYNPIRAEHEFKWYLNSRFPGSELNVINYAFHSRMLAFCSKPLHQKTVEKISYP